jgi:hypothetical protein
LYPRCKKVDKEDEEELSQRVQNFATHCKMVATDCKMVAYSGANQRNHRREQLAGPYANPWILQSPAMAVGDLEVISDLSVQKNFL